MWGQGKTVAYSCSGEREYNFFRLHVIQERRIFCVSDHEILPLQVASLGNFAQKSNTFFIRAHQFEESVAVGQPKGMLYSAVWVEKGRTTPHGCFDEDCRCFRVNSFSLKKNPHCTN